MPTCSRCGATHGATGHGPCPSCLLRLGTLPEAVAPDYEIETLLGAGKSGTTYLARDAAGGGLLAVKILTLRGDAHDGPGVAETIRAALTSFRHPAVAATHAVDVDDDGNVRLVRAYVPGKPFAAWAARADAEARAGVFEAIAEALDAAHTARLFHGHVAAPNIVMTAGGRPVLVDLGAHMALLALQGVDADPGALRHTDRAGLESLRNALERGL
jgi:serine/threonine protein kinase